jgi:hypothetical protein
LKGTGFTRCEKLAALKGTALARTLSRKTRFFDRKLVSLKGTGFSPYIKPSKITGALALRRKTPSLKGTGFSPYIKPAKITGALAPEAENSFFEGYGLQPVHYVQQKSLGL